MGTTAHVIVLADDEAAADGLVDGAMARLADLELRWSRFRPESEVSGMNAAAGTPVVVSDDTALLVERAVLGWHATAGRFDPTVLPALVAAGYDRSFGDLAPGARPSPDVAEPAPGCAGVAVDRDAGIVQLPDGVAFDPGGIGKGLAADLVTSELRARGAAGVCVNLGGDVRVDGAAPGGRDWVVDVEHPLSGTPVARVALAGGAVASSSRTKRTWGPDDAPAHHLIDPGRGAPAATGLAGVSVVTTQGWWAEVLAKAVFLAGPEGGAALLEARGVAGVLVDDSGGVQRVGLPDDAGLSLSG